MNLTSYPQLSCLDYTYVYNHTQIVEAVEHACFDNHNHQ